MMAYKIIIVRCQLWICTSVILCLFEGSIKVIS
jgi:hypothetical protein